MRGGLHQLVANLLQGLKIPRVLRPSLMDGGGDTEPPVLPLEEGGVGFLEETHCVAQRYDCIPTIATENKLNKLTVNGWS